MFALFTATLARFAQSLVAWIVAHTVVRQREPGQGLVEYALILVLVAVVVITVLQLLGVEITNVFTDIIAGLQTR